MMFVAYKIGKIHIQLNCYFPPGEGCVNVQQLLSSLNLDHLLVIFQKEHVTMDVLVDMTSEDLQSIGITAFGIRHKILKKAKEWIQTGKTGTV